MVKQKVKKGGKEIKDFIEKNEGEDMDPLTEMIIQSAKDLIQEIH